MTIQNLLKQRHSPESTWSWLEATGPTEGGGYTDATPYISAHPQQGAPSTDESPLPTGGTSAGLQGVVRVQGLPKDRVTAFITRY